MTDRTTPRLWAGLGLGAAVGLAAPALALAPKGPDAPAWGPVLAQAEGGEAGEAGEGGGEAGEGGSAGAAAAPAGGEAGEAGEAGALASEDATVAILGGLGLMEGHLRSGMEAAQSGDEPTAAVHRAHPAAEIAGQIEPLLAAQGTAPLGPELEAIGSAPTPEARVAATEAAIARFGAIRDGLAATPAQRFAALTAVLRTAAEEYAVGVADGTVANAQEYQDARGFVAAARAEAEKLAAIPEAADAAAQVIAALDAAAPAFPSFLPASLPADAPQLVAAAAARVEFAGLTVR